MSKENLLSKIILDAEAQAEEIKTTAEQASAVALDNAITSFNAEFEKVISKAKTDGEEIITQAVLNAEIEARKILLKAKQEVLSATIERSLEKLMKLPDSEYIALITDMIARVADDGDIVIISRNDEKRLTAEVIAKISKVIGKKLTLSSERGDFLGGVILSQNGLDKNMTLENELSEIKQERINKLSTKLFSNVE